VEFTLERSEGLRMTRRYMSLQINTPEAYKRLINNNVSKSVSLIN